MMHPWIRLPNVANMFGLVLGSTGLILTGLQLNMNLIAVIGTLAFSIFFILFILNLGLLIRDYKHYLPQFTKKLFGLIPY